MSELPPAKALQPLLRKLTERLATELGRPTGTTVPDWSELEWRMARGVAALHGVSPLLSRALKIELHQRVAEILPLRISDITDSILPRHPHPGLNAYPSKAALLIHLLIHAASSMAYRALRLLHLNDIALLCARMSESDWEELLDYGRAKGGPWWALPPLQLTARYYDTAIPTEVLRALAASCPWTLRQLTRRHSLSDVSLSYPWIEAFPGIGWCRSVAEMLEYISSRVRPSPHLLQLRKVVAQTQIASSSGEWANLSQGRRMLKWITSRQTPPDTLHLVRSAVAMPRQH